MVAELDGGEFWLPAEFFNDDLPTEGNLPLAVQGQISTACIPHSSQPKSATETVSHTELIRHLAHTFLYQDTNFSAYTSKVPTTETTMWPTLSRDGPKRPPPMPSSPAALQAQRQSKLDFLYAATWEVMRMKQMEHKFNRRRIQHLHLYQLNRQQLIKQQLAAAWKWQGSTKTAMASPPLPSQHPGMGVKAVQLDVRRSRRPSAGTGVFLPKREDIPSEALKKPELALNKCHQQQYDHLHIPAPMSPPLPPTAITNLDVLLPAEWTY